MISTPEVQRATERFAACDIAIRRAGGHCEFISDARSRYFRINGTRIRVADHPANGTPGLRDTRWDAEVRIDLADWWDSLAGLTGDLVPAILDVPAASYFADHSAISQSMLKTFMDRRRLYEAYFLTHEAEPPAPTDPMRKGTATHTAILEPDRFEQLVVTYPANILAKNGAVSTTEAKAFRDEHQAAGRVVLKEAEAAQVRAMAESVRRVCGEWLKLPAKKEQSVYWQDAVTELPCKMRLDWLVEHRRIVFDLKTSADASPEPFRKACEDRAYWLQVDHYLSGIKAATGIEAKFYFLVVESSFPYACAIHCLDADSLHAASLARCRLMIQLAKCLESGDFAEPWERTIQPLVMRPWAFEATFTGEQE